MLSCNCRMCPFSTLCAQAEAWVSPKWRKRAKRYPGRHCWTPLKCHRCNAGFFVCKLKKVANGPKDQLGGEEDVPSDMEGAEEGVTAEEEAPEKTRSARAGQLEGRKRAAAEVDAGEPCLPGMTDAFMLVPDPFMRGHMGVSTHALPLSRMLNTCLRTHTVQTGPHVLMSMSKWLLCCTCHPWDATSTSLLPHLCCRLGSRAGKEAEAGVAHLESGQART